MEQFLNRKIIFSISISDSFILSVTYIYLQLPSSDLANFFVLYGHLTSHPKYQIRLYSCSIIGETISNGDEILNLKSFNYLPWEFWMELHYNEPRFYHSCCL